LIPNREPDEFKKFQCTMLGENSNKWYNLEFWKVEQTVRITFGRVGLACVKPAVKQGITQKKFDKLVSDRLKKRTDGTQYFEVDLHQIAKKSAAFNFTLDSIVNKRIKKIFDEANESIAGFLSVAVDSLSVAQIDKGKNKLKEIVDFYSVYENNNKKHKDGFLSLAEQYYQLIPTKLPYKIDPLQVAINLVKNADTEEDKLQQLAAAISTLNVKTDSTSSIFDYLGAILEPVDDKIFKLISEKVLNTRKHSGYERLKVLEIYSVLIPQERKRFEECDIDNVELLYHGTNPSNIRHILNKYGLKIPSYPSNGSAFGLGTYFADVSTKSLNYCGYKKEKYLFLADVKLGKQYKTNSTLNWIKFPDRLSDYHSIWAEEGNRLNGLWNNTLQYSEYIIFNSTQQTLRYLVITE
jgi:poly [ADP-ribose] polymerase 2/3/4